VTYSPSRRGLQRRRPTAVAGFVILQTVAAVFFLGDALGDLLTVPETPHSIFESLVAVALVLGVVFGGWELRRTLDLMRAQQTALAVASGALAEVIRTEFTLWGLTAAEQDVGFFALKGLDVAEIAAMRGSAPGTVRAQLTHVYAKAGVSNRSQFVALFMEDLLGSRLTPAADVQP